MILVQNKNWRFEGEADPLKGPKGDTAFLKDNYRLMGIGGIFRTPKTRFTPARIHAGAKDAGFIIRIDDETPWWKITIIGKLPRKTKTEARTRSADSSAASKKRDSYTGAGKEYPDIPEAEPIPDIFS